MEEGSMRVDANVSIRPAGSGELGTRCEIKNLNSLRSLVRAIDHEIARQAGVVEAGERVVQQTRHWDEEAGRTVALRSKEEAFDYRYFPEPDLVPVAPGSDWQKEVAAALPAMPAERRARLRGLVAPDGPPASAALDDQIATVVEQDLDGLVAAAVEGGVGPALALARTANEAAAAAEAARSVDAEAYRSLLLMEQGGTITATQAKAVLGELLEHGGDPADIARRKGFEAMDADRLAAAVAEVVAGNAEEWDRYRTGEDKLAQFFIGLVMRATSGKADGKAVVAELRRLRG
jgi:aspartyl-tRNA(Asn)/glutamyl-tRNA(Gln) amidotransferase subunit B